jgi:murein DD-endopeptidase MepM/ murein hydrolase activator NlpD
VSKQADGRYVGRRRVPTPPRSRYAAVVTTAFVGAGVVALGAGAAITDVKPPSPYVYGAGGAGLTGLSVEDRQAALDRANRSKERPGPASSVEQASPNYWRMPVYDYHITTLYEYRWGEFHPGLDLATAWGRPFYAAAGGTVVLARYNGGYGNNIQIDHGNGVVTLYGHASKLVVKEGDRVEAGQMIGRIGDTGYSTGPHLHFEVLVNGETTNPVPFLLSRGVDITKRVEAATGGVIIN